MFVVINNLLYEYLGDMKIYFYRKFVFYLGVVFGNCNFFWGNKLILIFYNYVMNVYYMYKCYYIKEIYYSVYIYLLVFVFFKYGCVFNIGIYFMIICVVVVVFFLLLCGKFYL